MRRAPASFAADHAALARYVIPNLRNACRILKQLGSRPEGCKAADLARELKIPVTTTLRIMATLQVEGLVRKAGGRFGLGPVLIHLGNAALAGTEIRAAALPIIEQLTAATDETSHLAIPCDHRALIVAVQDSPHPLRAASRPGYLAELHCSATGKVFLAHLYQDRLAEILRKSPPARRTPHSLTGLTEIRRELARIREQGYALDDEEYHTGVRCLAAPVRSSTNTVIGAIGITAAALRFTRERIPEIAAKVTAAAAAVSRVLGCGALEPILP